MKATARAYTGMQFLNGKKTWLGVLGVALAIAQCLVRHGFNVESVIHCVTDVLSTGGAVGATGMLALLGAIHKREKANA